MADTLSDCPLVDLLRSHGVSFYTDADGLWAREDVRWPDGTPTVEWVLMDAMDRDEVLGWLGYGEEDLEVL